MSKLFDRLVLKDITDTEIAAFLALCKPLNENDDGKLATILNLTKDYRTSAFMWDAKPGEVVAVAEEVARIKTYHVYAYYGFFKPSLDEVAGQCRDKALELGARYFHAQMPDQNKPGWMSTIWPKEDGTYEVFREGERDFETYLNDKRDHVGVHVTETVLYK